MIEPTIGRIVWFTPYESDAMDVFKLMNRWLFGIWWILRGGPVRQMRWRCWRLYRSFCKCWLCKRRMWELQEGLDIGWHRGVRVAWCAKCSAAGDLKEPF